MVFSSRHRLSLLMVLMVVLGHCNGEEYADGCMVGNPRQPIFGIGDYEDYRHDMVIMTREEYIARAYAEMMQHTGWDVWCLCRRTATVSNVRPQSAGCNSTRRLFP